MSRCKDRKYDNEGERDERERERETVMEEEK